MIVVFDGRMSLRGNRSEVEICRADFRRIQDFALPRDIANESLLERQNRIAPKYPLLPVPLCLSPEPLSSFVFLICDI
jgi:hypothetical protein